MDEIKFKCLVSDGIHCRAPMEDKRVITANIIDSLRKPTA